MKHFSFVLPFLVVLIPVASFASPLNDAAGEGDVAEIAAALDSGADINQPDEKTTPLTEAIANKHLEAVQLLIQRGADVNRPGKFRRMPLELAAMKNNAEIVKLLLHRGAKPDVGGGSTPLQAAANSGCLPCVKDLVEAGADVNLLTSNGWPAIHIARINQHDDIAEFLREHGTRKPVLPPIADSLKSAKPEVGQKIFAQNCLRCHHSLHEVNDHDAPPLWGVVGREIGSVEGFHYTPAMKEEDGIWTYEAINVFISNPAQTVPGVNMLFDGMQEETQRADVIAYLRTLSDTPLPLPE